MLEYLLFSGLIFYCVSGVSRTLIDMKAEEHGYVCMEDFKKKSFGGELRRFIFSFIPVINNIWTVLLLGACGIMIFADSEKVEKVLAGAKGYEKLRNARWIIEHREKLYNEKELSDSYKLDGLEEEEIKENLKLDKNDLGITNTDMVNRLKAMGEAERFMDEVSLYTEFTNEEKDKLFPSYVNDFQNENEKSRPKAVQKTLRMINKRK